MVAITAAVQKEIERQQSVVNYDELSTEELNASITSLTAKLELCKAALQKKDGTLAAPKLVAAKATGSWPDLPWGGEFTNCHTCCTPLAHALRHCLLVWDHLTLAP